ncbi:MAG: YtxH domain-containing protein [Bacteroidetes bacterium]|nr:YtxH domain-containing protein [Bacteroidales bacterium]NJO68076.1 YtxH domain-containing protein [Bacteroidota bacterium]
MSTGKMLLGIMAGAAAGAVLGILFAPDKGTETRRKIMERGNDYVSDLKEKFNDFIDNLTERYESVKDDASEYAQNPSYGADDFQKDVRSQL